MLNTTNLSIVDERTGAPGTTVLVVSRERVGRAFIVQSLRALGLHTLVSDNGQQAVRRLRTGHAEIHGVVIVGDLADSNAESYGRWLRAEGFAALPLVGVGVEVDGDDPFAVSLDAREWLGSCRETLENLGLVTPQRRATDAPASTAPLVA